MESVILNPFVERVLTSVVAVALPIKGIHLTVARRSRAGVAIKYVDRSLAQERTAIRVMVRMLPRVFWTPVKPAAADSSVNKPSVGRFRISRIAVGLCVGVFLGLIGCNPARTATKDRLTLLTKTLVAGDWKDLGPFIASGESEGWAMSPSQLAQFLQAYADCESRHVALHPYFPGHIPSTLGDSSSKVTVYVRADAPGLTPVVVPLIARHAGEGIWLVREREMAGGFLGVLHPDFDERYRCIREALLKTHLPRYGSRGHYTTPDRIQAFLEHKIGRDRLYSANPDSKPELLVQAAGGK